MKVETTASDNKTRSETWSAEMTEIYVAPIVRSTVTGSLRGSAVQLLPVHEIHRPASEVASICLFVTSHSLSYNRADTSEFYTRAISDLSTTRSDTSDQSDSCSALSGLSTSALACFDSPRTCTSFELFPLPSLVSLSDHRPLQVPDPSV